MEKYNCSQNKNHLEKAGMYCFYLAVIIEVLLVVLDKSAFTNPVEGRIFQITFCLCVVKVLSTAYSLKEWVCIFIFCILGGVSYLATGRNEVIRLVLLIAACKNVDMKRCLKLVFYLTLAGCLAIMILSVTGIYGEMALTQDYGRGAVETRYTLGMGHPNALQCMVWALSVLAIYLYGEKMKIVSCGILLFSNVAFFMLTDSKTSLICAVTTILLLLLSKYVIRIKRNIGAEKFLNVGNFLIFMGSVGISIAAARGAYIIYEYVWSGRRDIFAIFWKLFDKVLNGRIYGLINSVNWEGTMKTWSLFSRPENNYYFDMGWVRLFYWYGIIPAVVFIIATALLLYACMKNHDHMAVILIVSFALYSVIEAHAFSDYLARNYVFFIMGMYWNKMLCLEGKQEENLWRLPWLLKRRA